jgi:hypothetical protein
VYRSIPYLPFALDYKVTNGCLLAFVPNTVVASLHCPLVLVIVFLASEYGTWFGNGRYREWAQYACSDVAA